MDTVIESSKEVSSTMSAAQIACSNILASLYEQAMDATPVVANDIGQGLEIDLDFETIEVNNLVVDEAFLEFFINNKSTIIQMNILYKMWLHFVPHRAPDEVDLLEMNWPTQWVNENLEYLETFSKKYS